MPFKKVRENDYVSPSGRHFTKKQVKAYHANGGFKRKAQSKKGCASRGSKSSRNG